MKRCLLTMRYDGTAYHGWQVQKNAVTVQQTLQDAVEALTGVRSGVIGCSRTDAGVHAEMFCCTFDTDSALDGDAMVKGLNAHLPRDVAVTGCRRVPADFHPRYAALGKRYVYRVWNSRVRHPFWDRFTAQVGYPLPAEDLTAAAAAFVGTHDFAAFQAAGSSVTDTVRTVRRFEVMRKGDLVCFTVEADGFLYNMVRIMVGTLLEMAAGSRNGDDIPRILLSGRREEAGRTAPAKGLCLERVFYPPPYDTL